MVVHPHPHSMNSLGLSFLCVGEYVANTLTRRQNHENRQNHREHLSVNKKTVQAALSPILGAQLALTKVHLMG